MERSETGKGVENINHRGISEKVLYYEKYHFAKFIRNILTHLYSNLIEL